MKKVSLTRGYITFVDDADFEYLNQWNWYAFSADKLTYAARKTSRDESKKDTRKTVLMHRELLKAPEDLQIDHRDGDGLNNRRKNLRLATNLQNRQGFQRKQPGCSSRFRGVCFNTLRKKWQASIRVLGRMTYLGLFLSEVKAAKAYDIAARKYFGEFASPNFL